MINKDLKEYIDKNILIHYDNFDKGHDINHVTHVINFSLYLCDIYKLNEDICYTAASYHDIGLYKGRDLHNEYSYKYVLNDVNLYNWFNEREINIIALACKEHRSSNKLIPESIYSKIISDADKTDGLTIERMLTRSYGYNLNIHPDLSNDKIFELIYNHLKEKYGKGGYSKLLLPESKIYANEAREKIIEILSSKENTKSIFMNLYK